MAILLMGGSACPIIGRLRVIGRHAAAVQLSPWWRLGISYEVPDNSVMFSTGFLPVKY